MNRPELYHKTVDILYQAYFNDTLEHGRCTACAVGNIIAGNGVPRLLTPDVTSNNSYNNASWKGIFFTGYEQYWGEGKDMFGFNRDMALATIKATGYSVDELAKIEFAFEKAPFGISDEDWMYNGLVAVLDVLAQTHQVTDTDLLSSTGKRFSDHHKTRTLCAANS